MSQTESGATSPAQAQAANSGDGQNKPAANVSAAEAVRRFVQASEKQAEATAQTADTPATPPQEAADESPAVESVPTDSPEATSESPAEGAPEPEQSETETTEGEGENTAEAEEVLSPESQTLDAKTKERIQRRIDKEVGKRKALEAQLEQVQAQLQELTSNAQPTQDAPATTPPVDSAEVAPLPDVKTTADLEAYKKQIKTAARNIEALLDREDVDQGVQWGDKTYTKAELKALMRDARVTLEDTIPEQEKFFQKQTQVQTLRQQARQVALNDFPFLADKSAPEQKLVKQLYAAVPLIKQAVNGDYLAGLMVLGEQKRQELLAAKAKDKAEKPKPAAPAIPKQKPPASQTVSSTAGTVARISPNQGRVIPKPSGNQTAHSAAEILKQRELARANQA